MIWDLEPSAAGGAMTKAPPIAQSSFLAREIVLPLSSLVSAGPKGSQ